jgi:hypothetical protein
MVERTCTITLNGGFMRSILAPVLPALGLFVLACSDGSSPTSPSTAPAGMAWGPETPDFNLEVILRGDGFGHVKFRQPNDADAIIYLDTWVRDLAPNTEYVLQRAVDPVIDDVCTSTAWLTLGRGLQPQSIVTDASGTGKAELFRNVSAFPAGTEFDIHFRLVNAQTQAVVLQSECYQFRISL